MSTLPLSPAGNKRNTLPPDMAAVLAAAPCLCDLFDAEAFDLRGDRDEDTLRVNFDTLLPADANATDVLRLVDRLDTNEWANRGGFAVYVEMLDKSEVAPEDIDEAMAARIAAQGSILVYAEVDRAEWARMRRGW